MVIERRPRSKGQGKTYTRTRKLPINFDLSALTLMCNYVMSENTDILTQIANNVVDGMECAVDTKLFAATNYVRTAANKQREHKFKDEDIEFNLNDNGMKYIGNEWTKATTNNKLDNNIINNPLQLFI